jgi:hypothetical protein
MSDTAGARVQREAEAFLTSRGATGISVRQGKNQPTLIFTYAGTQHSVPFSGSPRDPRAPAQVVRQLRRLLHRCGTPSPRPPPPPPPPVADFMAEEGPRHTEIGAESEPGWRAFTRCLMAGGSWDEAVRDHLHLPWVFTTDARAGVYSAKHELRMMVPVALVEAYAFSDVACQVDHVGGMVLHISRSPSGTGPHLRPDGPHRRMLCVSQLSLPASVTEALPAPPHTWPVRACALPGAMLVCCDFPKHDNNGREVVTGGRGPWPSTPDAEFLRDALARLRHIEASTAYRLIKRADNHSWAFQAPRIE